MYRNNRKQRDALSEEEVNCIRPIFEYFDMDRDGFIGPKEARTIFAQLGYPPEQSTIKGSNITFEELIEGINSKKQAGTLGRDDLEGTIRRAFSMMKASDPSSDTISFRQFKKFVLSLGLKADEEILHRIYCRILFNAEPEIKGNQEGFQREDLVNFVLDNYDKAHGPLIFE